MVPKDRRGAKYKEQTLMDLSPDTAESVSLDDGDAVSEVADAAEVRVSPVPNAMHLQRLDKVLVSMAPEFSRNHLQHLIERGHVHLDGAVAGPASRRVKAAQKLQVQLVPTEESLAFRPEAMSLDVLFEDEHLLVINKPAGLVVHPAPGHWAGTLLNGLLARHPAAATLPRAGIVHRLDKDTSGVMMVGKTLPAVTALVRDLAGRVVHRRYLALAHGLPKSLSFSVDAPIGRDPRVRVRMAVVPVPAGGRPSRTDLQCVAQLPGKAPLAAYLCTLHSGRTHQIRVHMASEGLPLVADVLYGGKLALGMQRQALHATQLQLCHPISRESLAFECASPPDFAAAWAEVCSHATTDVASHLTSHLC
jgi:23S rRNA pseudouridine1911/1915/1917 synthase